MRGQRGDESDTRGGYEARWWHQLGRGFCQKYLDIPDTVVPSHGAVMWYHRNDYAKAFPGSNVRFLQLGDAAS